MIHWYAAIVRRQKERAFCDHLAEAGFVGYVPREEKRMKVSRAPVRWETKQVPLIRGLVFIGGDADLAGDAYAWHAVASIPHYKALVGSDGVPRLIRQREIDVMMDARRDKDDLVVGWQPKVKAGDMARITVGAFEGVTACKVRELAGRRAVIMAQLLGGEREIEVDEDALEPIAAE